MLTCTSLFSRTLPSRRTLIARASSSSRTPPTPTGNNAHNASGRPTSSPVPAPAPVPSRATDPFPLPLSPELVLGPSFEGLPPAPSEGDQDLRSLLAPLRKDRTEEDVQTLRARLVYQTRKRGMLENDLLLSTFARENLEGMSESELREFDRLLDEPDWDIYYWSIEKRDPPARWASTPLLEKLKQHAKNEGKVVRRMPDLWEGRESAGES